MRVLLINPPIEDFFFTPQRAHPLGLLYLATILHKEGFEVKILNSCKVNKKFSLEWPKEFSYLKEYYRPNKSAFSLFNNYCHFGLKYSQIKDKIIDFSPDIVGISSNFTPYFSSALKVARIVKEVDKRIIVILGGRLPTALPEFVLKNKCVDFVIRGEAEYSLAKLCKGIKKGKVKPSNIEGLCYKTKKRMKISSRICLVKNLNLLPFPERRLIDYKNYKFKGEISTSIIASRGCNLGCSFCAIKEKFRYRSAENVFEEIKYCFELGIRHINFEDDNINLNPQFERLLDLIIKNFEGEIKISFMNGLLAYGLTPSLRKKLIKAGLTHIDFSLVSSKKRLRKRLNRIEEVKDIVSCTNYMTKHNIPVNIHFIVGFPGQNFKDAIEDIKFLSRKRAILGPSIFYPVVESKLFEELKDKFSLKETDYKFFRSSCAYFNKDMSYQDMFFIFYLSRVINFIKKIIDLKFSLNRRNFLKFLKDKTEGLYFEKEKVIAQHKLDKFTLGIIVLNKLLKEKKFFRVEEKKCGNKFIYSFFEEKFVPSSKLSKILGNLCIKGLSGNFIYL
jgi:radical SAM superfamily enzyme YgiQ (UPF0313 family)